MTSLLGRKFLECGFKTLLSFQCVSKQIHGKSRILIKRKSNRRYNSLTLSATMKMLYAGKYGRPYGFMFCFVSSPGRANGNILSCGFSPSCVVLSGVRWTCSASLRAVGQQVVRRECAPPRSNVICRDLQQLRLNSR